MMAERRNTKLVVNRGLAPLDRVVAFENALRTEFYNIMYSRRKSMGVPGAMAAELSEELESGLRQIQAEKGVRLQRHLAKSFTDPDEMREYVQSTERLAVVGEKIGKLRDELLHSLAQVGSTRKQYCMKIARFAYDEISKWRDSETDGGVEQFGKQVTILVLAGCAKGSQYGSWGWWSWLSAYKPEKRFTVFRVDLLVMGAGKEFVEFWKKLQPHELLLESDRNGNIKDRSMHRGQSEDTLVAMLPSGGTSPPNTNLGVHNRFRSLDNLGDCEDKTTLEEHIE
jgi:hypothetical protein